MARYDAQKMRLTGTADRLGILRKELSRYHEVPDEGREIKRRWALAKLEDTERTFVREKEQVSQEDLEHFDSMRSISKFMKTAVYLGLTATVMNMLNHVAGGSMADIALVLAGGAAMAIAMSRMVERFIGGNIESASRNIEKAIKECRDALQRR